MVPIVRLRKTKNTVGVNQLKMEDHREYGTVDIGSSNVALDVSG